MSRFLPSFYPENNHHFVFLFSAVAKKRLLKKKELKQFPVKGLIFVQLQIHAMNQNFAFFKQMEKWLRAVKEANKLLQRFFWQLEFSAPVLFYQLFL